MANNSIVALIPARVGSLRVEDKNVGRMLGGVPLYVTAIRTAVESSIFECVYVSSQTDDDDFIRTVEREGATFIRRPDEFGTSTSPDIEWLRHALEHIMIEPDFFAILRLTSPFRTSETIRRAWIQFRNAVDAGKEFDSLRAVEKAFQHPAKMWTVQGGRLIPLLLQPDGQPWHSSQYQTLPTVFAQNASLEIARTETVFKTNTIAGDKIMPFFTEGYEGFDINTELDLKVAQMLIDSGEVSLPSLYKEGVA